MRGLRLRRAAHHTDAESGVEDGPVAAADAPDPSAGHVTEPLSEPEATEPPATQAARGVIVRPEPMDPGMAAVLAGKLSGAPEGCPVGSCAHCGEPAVATGDGFRFKHVHLTPAAAAPGSGSSFVVTLRSQYCDPHNLASASMKSGKDVRDPQLVGFDRSSATPPTSPGLRWARDLVSGDTIIWGNKVETIAETELALGSLRLCFTSGKIAEYSLDAHDVLYRVPAPDEVSTWADQWKDDGAWLPATSPLLPGRDSWSGPRFLGAFVAKTLLHKCVYADEPTSLMRIVAAEDFGTVWDVSAQRALHWAW